MKNPEFFVWRDQLLNAALEHVAALKGKAQDVAIFDFLCGAVRAAFIAGIIDSECPPFLWIVGIRAGSRVAEIRKMLAESVLTPSAS